jgi:hypothetical protein
MERRFNSAPASSEAEARPARRRPRERNSLGVVMGQRRNPLSL